MTRPDQEKVRNTWSHMNSLAPIGEQMRRSEIVSVRFTPSELESVQALAANRNLSISAYLRCSALPHEHNWVLVSSYRSTVSGLDTRKSRCLDSQCRIEYTETVPL